VDGPAALGELISDDVLVLAVKSQDTAGAVRQWAAAPVAAGGVAGDRLPIVCAQNGSTTSVRFSGCPARFTACAYDAEG
jgi:2-dehydropantoate 2-reductase